ncbi:MAG: hypothetical protein RL748_3273, partial [Pseudomonadota bacterium]
DSLLAQLRAPELCSSAIARLWFNRCRCRHRCWQFCPPKHCNVCTMCWNRWLDRLGKLNASENQVRRKRRKGLDGIPSLSPSGSPDVLPSVYKDLCCKPAIEISKHGRCQSLASAVYLPTCPVQYSTVSLMAMPTRRYFAIGIWQIHFNILHHALVFMFQNMAVQYIFADIALIAGTYFDVDCI